MTTHGSILLIEHADQQADTLTAVQTEKTVTLSVKIYVLSGILGTHTITQTDDLLKLVFFMFAKIAINTNTNTANQNNMKRPKHVKRLNAQKSKNTKSNMAT